MKLRTLNLGILFITAALITGCAVHGANSAAQTAAIDAITGGVPAIDGAANMANTQVGAISVVKRSKTSTFAKNLNSFLIPDAEATPVSCGQFAAQATCSSGSQSASYSACTNWGGTLTGQVTLTYKEAACTMATVGDTVERLVNVTRSGLSGGSVMTDSENPTTAWNGTAIGTGATLTTTGTDAYTLSIGGTHKELTNSSGVQVYDISVLTTVPMTLTGALAGTRTLSGGSVTVYHNSAKYQAVLVPNNLQYSLATCCHPVGGTITATYTGSFTGTGTATFSTSCGVVSVAYDGLTENVQLQGCE